MYELREIKEMIGVKRERQRHVPLERTVSLIVSQIWPFPTSSPGVPFVMRWKNRDPVADQKDRGLWERDWAVSY